LPDSDYIVTVLSAIPIFILKSFIKGTVKVREMRINTNGKTKKNDKRGFIDHNF